MSRFIYLLILFCFFLNQQTKAQCPADCRYLYVDGAIATSGVGTSWATAFKTLQEAIDAANTSAPADTIIVKQGTYKPDNGSDRTKSFVIDTKEVYLYGGYVGTELETVTGGLIPLANPVANVTILSGDIGTVGVHTDNSYHVLQILNTTKGKMLGFTISRGRADGAGIDANGGGIFASNSTFDLEFIKITNNHAASLGGGMYSDNSLIYLYNMSSGYTAIGGFGIDNNTAGAFGGAIYYASGQMKANNIFFGNNTATSAGGAVYVASSVTVTDFYADLTFRDNRVTAGMGGAIYLNGVTGWDTYPSNTISKATFLNNEANEGGGLLASNCNNLNLTNMIFNDNIATNNGGGMLLFQCDNTKIQHITFKGNTANQGAGMFINGSGGGSFENVEIYNTLFWGNRDNAINPNSITANNIGGIFPSMFNCLFEEDETSFAMAHPNISYDAGTCIFNQDPQFLFDYAEDVMIVPKSPAAEKGAVLSPEVNDDRFGYIRSCIPDIGAIEVQRLWTGGIGNTASTAGTGNWNVAENWTPDQLLPTTEYTIPSGTFTAVIRSGAVTMNTNSAAHAVYLEGGTLTMNTNVQLSVKRLFQRTGGTFNSGEGTENVIFENDCHLAPYNLSQKNTIVSGRLTFNYLTVNNNDDLFVGSSQLIAVKRLLRLAVGNFYIDNNLALLSNANYTAMLINNAYSILGTNPMNTNRNVIVQRYVTPYAPRPAGLGYTYFSSPVQGTRVSDFAPIMNLVLDNGVNPYYWFNPFYTASNFPTFFKYVEGNNNIFEGGAAPQAGWRCPTINEVLEVGRGYIANLNSGVTMNFRGYLNNGTVNVPITRGSAGQSGWNLVGNPYPSPINWTTLYGLNSTIVTTGIWRRIATGQYTGIFDYYIQGTPVGSNGGTAEIQSSQGFFVRATTNGTLTMNNTVRTTSGYSNPQFFRTEESEDKNELEGFVRIELKNSRIADGTIVSFYAKATEEIDANFDMEKVMLNSNNAPNFYTKNEGKRIAINGLPTLTQRQVIPLYFMTFENGQHTIAATHISHFRENVLVILEDKTLGILHDLRTKPYVFTTTANNGAENNRFQLHIVPNTNTNFTEWAEIAIFPNPVQAELKVRALSKQAENLQVVIYDELGREVMAGEIVKKRDVMEDKFDVSHLKNGLYIVELRQGTYKMTQKVLKQ